MDGAGQGAVTDGGDSILEFERWRRTGDPAILQAISDYNEEDCVSTVKLRDWLLERKAEAERARARRSRGRRRKPTRITESAWRKTRPPRQRSERLRSTIGAAAARRPARTITAARPSRRGGPTSSGGRSRWTICIDDTEAIAELTPATDEQPRPRGASFVYPLRLSGAGVQARRGRPGGGPVSRSALPARSSHRQRAGATRAEAGRKASWRAAAAALVSGRAARQQRQRKALGRVADASSIA